ncbi:MAG TPA: thioredoxin-dependent thiol peroxidase [Chloroflexota bacterium]|jgi:peroxiredoxin Q/BCP|nr:thioredoxin-dependent thiol peroxidase [Chloroflexota bacterium]
MTDLQPGDQAPDFDLETSKGRVALRDLRGKRIVLYFYPKDDTPGCTKEACSFRDSTAAFEGAGAVVIGVSPDSTASHDRFAAKYGLPFLLASDPDHATATVYGAWGQKKFMGRSFEGVLRSTFVIDAEGKITRIFPDVKPDGHADQVLAALA